MEVPEAEKRTGLKEDLEFLLQRFIQTQNVRFQMFAEEWRNLNFSLIHYGIEKGQEKKQVMQESFQIIMDYFLPPYDLQHRVGALYILYSLYMTQPHVPKYKIRISIDQWKTTTKLMETLQGQGHLDAIYIFHKLVMSKAFMLTAKPKRMIFHSNFMIEGKAEENPTERWLQRHRHSLMTECFDDTTLELHHDLHEQYQSMKASLGLHDNTSLMVVRESITEYIVKRFEKLETDFEAGREPNYSTDSSDEECEDRATRISQIKARSFSTIAKPSRSRRHLQQTTEPSTSQSHSPTKSRGGRGRRGCKGQRGSNRQTSDSPDSSSDGAWTPGGAKKSRGRGPKKSAASRGGRARKGPAIPTISKTEPNTQTGFASIDSINRAVGRKTSKKQLTTASPEMHQLQAPPKTHKVELHHIETFSSEKTSDKRGRSDTGSSVDQEEDSSPKGSPRKKMRTSIKTERTLESASTGEPLQAADNQHSDGKTDHGERKRTSGTSSKKPDHSAGQETLHGSDNQEGSSQDADEVDNHGSSSREELEENVRAGHHQQGSSRVLRQSPEGQRSVSVRGRGSTSPRTTRSKEASPKGHQGQSPRKQGQMPRRRNTTLKVRGGGLGARTRGARRNVSK